jgi:hypothetical protein
MEYRVKRGEQEFGPYTLTDLQQYLQSGNLASTDEARSEAMSDWMPLSQILGNIPAPAMAYAGAPGFGESIPFVTPVDLPPNLHWAILLVINLVTRSYFNMIWAFFQANWARKLSGKNTPMVLIAMYPAGLVSGGVAVGFASITNQEALSGLGIALIVAGLICMIAGVFSIKNAMESYYNTVENIGMSLSGVMTFFFGTVYLQFHINRLARWKKTGVLS